ncbi:MAG: N-6 DNA methylase [Candidatus Micrarchaeaceae archaeon]
MVRINLTEKSYRKEFIKKLGEILEPHNLVIYDDPSISFVDAENSKVRTRFPDIVIAEKDKIHQEGDWISIAKDGVIAVIETKKAQKGVYSGVSQALDYMGYLDTKHAFATNFKDVIGFQIIEGKPKIDEKLNSVLNEAAISSVINFIVDVLLHKKELQPIELNDDLIVKILEGSVSEILEYMQKVGSEKLEEPLGFFFAKKLDTKILESPKSRKEFALAIRKAGAYLIVNQILFYRILSVEEGSKYQEIKKIDKVPDLQKYFDRVLEDDYKSIFGAKVSSFLNDDSVDALNSIIRAVKVLRLERIKHDILGKIFHGLIPKELRKRIAAYYTSNSAGELLANICIDDKDVKVIDPACGSGTLLVSCYKRKRELYGEDTIAFHESFTTLSVQKVMPLLVSWAQYF